MERPTLSAFYENSDGWPAWPFLPVKNYDKRFTKPEDHGMPATGLMIEGSAKVFDANLFGGVGDLSKLFGDYKTVEEAEADGWIVD